MVRLEPQEGLLPRQGQYLGAQVLNSEPRQRVRPEKKGAKTAIVEALTDAQKPGALS